MSWIKALRAYSKWFLSIAVLIALITYDQKVAALKLELNAATGEIASKEMQYKTAQSFNESLNATVKELSKLNAESHTAEEWSRTFNAAMAANLEKAKNDIGMLIDEATLSSDCRGTYSPDVYQRMLDFYRASETD
ncbi:hypothetical protein NM449_17550 (plasmid) [Vibrio metschnikovii]|uniref:hypothetical protein n=1 Tax=Vibrio metschnikovii TaxID=28172 RepID=UPI002A620BCA|nr:hypothetical protein [Vibrio metschnikovii]